MQQLVYLPSDPYLCPNWAPGGYRSAAYTSYSGTHAPYAAAEIEREAPIGHPQVIVNTPSS